MILRMYSVYDIKAKIYHPPHFCLNVGHATRMFQSQFRKPGSIMNEYPEDFQIWECGAYDDATCEMEVLKNPTFICSVADLLQMKGKDDDKISETT